jgi:hypothetical protein
MQHNKNNYNTCRENEKKQKQKQKQNLTKKTKALTKTAGKY